MKQPNLIPSLILDAYQEIKQNMVSMTRDQAMNYFLFNMLWLGFSGRQIAKLVLLDRDLILIFMPETKQAN